MKTYFKIIISTIIAGSVASLAFADVPISTPTKYVECLCVTSAAQTCVTREHGGDFMNVSNTLNSSCINGVYSAKIINDDDIGIGNAFTAYILPRNRFLIGLTDSGIPFPVIQKCSTSSDFLTWLSYDFLTWLLSITCTPDFPGQFNPGPLGTDSGVACKRAGGATGTLHETGNIVTVPQILVINGLPNGDGLGSRGGCNGLSSCGVPIGPFPPVRTHQNYSCY